MSGPVAPLEDRLEGAWAVDSAGCWIWLRRLNPAGYGMIDLKGGVGKGGWRGYLAHRVVYEHVVGPIPDDLPLDHLCRVRRCVNPAHVEPVPLRENAIRGFGPSGKNYRKTHCKRGHEFTPENTRIRNRGGNEQRECKTCARELMARWHILKTAERAN